MLAMLIGWGHIDVFVHPENTVPPPKIQGPLVGSNSLDGITPFFQIPRIVIPAGTTDALYEPRYALSADERNYVSVLPPGTPKSKLAHPMPVALTLRLRIVVQAQFFHHPKRSLLRSAAKIYFAPFIVLMYFMAAMMALGGVYVAVLLLAALFRYLHL